MVDETARLAARDALHPEARAIVDDTVALHADSKRIMGSASELEERANQLKARAERDPAIGASVKAHLETHHPELVKDFKDMDTTIGGTATSTATPATPATPATETSARVPVSEAKTLKNYADFEDHQAINGTSHTNLKAHEDILGADANRLHSEAVNSMTAANKSSVSATVDRIEAMNGEIENATSDIMKKHHTTQRDRLTADLKKDGGKYMREHGKAMEAAAKAQTAIEKEAEKVTKKLGKHYDEQVKLLQKQLKATAPTDTAAVKKIDAELERIATAHNANIEAINEAKVAKIEALDEHITASKEAIANIEKHTGLKASDHISKSAATVATSGKAPEGLMEKVKANFTGEGVKTSTKVFRGAGTVVGLGAMIDGLKKIVAPKRNEQGEREGTMFGAVGEAGLGAALAYASAVGFAKGKGLGK